MISHSSAVSSGTVFDLLADSRCLTVLEYLRERQDIAVPWGSLVEHVVAVETAAWNGTVPLEYPDYVADDLRRAVLPKLSHRGLVDYDRSAGTIRYRGHHLVDAILRLQSATQLESDVEKER